MTIYKKIYTFVHDSENKDGDTRKFYFNIDKVFGRF
jgi:hypothetical protein